VTLIRIPRRPIDAANPRWSVHACPLSGFWTNTFGLQPASSTAWLCMTSKSSDRTSKLIGRSGDRGQHGLRECPVVRDSRLPHQRRVRREAFDERVGPHLDHAFEVCAVGEQLDPQITQSRQRSTKPSITSPNRGPWDDAPERIHVGWNCKLGEVSGQRLPWFPDRAG